MCIFKLYFMYFFFISIVFLLLGMWMIYVDNMLVLEWEFLQFNSIYMTYPVILDYMSCIFLGIVFMISSMVILYSSSYMKEEKFKFRFFCLVVLFILSMVFLIISPNLISILLGWDGLGLVSYCLVIFYQNSKSASAGMLTALTNRMGDVFILIGVCCMVCIGSVNFMFMKFVDVFLSPIMLASFMIFLASLTKSAQIPYSSWLPAAMAAPTPVSALVHSSTLVTAGVYLMIRFSPIFMKFNNQVNYLMFISSCTMLMAGMAACLEVDMKKIIALSTLSQLGVMMCCLSLNMVELCFFHLIVHALFKSLLFMCAGSMIHSNFDNQDLRKYGYTMDYIPLKLIYFMASNLALCGMPFLSGFYSKDIILETMCMDSTNLIIFIVFFLSTGLTVSYTFRLICVGLTYKYNYIGNLILLDDTNKEEQMSMNMMFLFSIFFGKLGFKVMLMSPYNLIILPMYLKFLIPFICMCGGVFGSLLADKIQGMITPEDLTLTDFIMSMWCMSILSPSAFKSESLEDGEEINKSSTMGWLEKLFTEFLTSVISFSSKKVEKTFSLNFLYVSFFLWCICLAWVFMNSFYLLK